MATHILGWKHSFLKKNTTCLKETTLFVGVVGAILITIGGAILIICVSNFRNPRDECGVESKLLPQLQLSLPNNMDPNKYFSGYNLKNAGRK